MKHRILADEPLPDDILQQLDASYTVDVLLPEQSADLAAYEALITYGHPPIGGGFMDRMTQLRLISNFGVGVDHIDLAAAKERGLPVGYTPNLMNGAADGGDEAPDIEGGTGADESLRYLDQYRPRRGCGYGRPARCPANPKDRRCRDRRDRARTAAGATRLAMGKMTVDNLEAGLAGRELLQRAI